MRRPLAFAVVLVKLHGTVVACLWCIYCTLHLSHTSDAEARLGLCSFVLIRVRTADLQLFC